MTLARSDGPGLEDDGDVRDLLVFVLLEADFAVDCSESVAQALALLDSCSYDFVLADGMLPDGTGMMVADKAAEQGIKTLIITGFGHGLPGLDGYDFLLKPVPLRELLDAIEQRLQPR